MNCMAFYKFTSLAYFNFWTIYTNKIRFNKLFFTVKARNPYLTMFIIATLAFACIRTYQLHTFIMIHVLAYRAYAIRVIIMLETNKTQLVIILNFQHPFNSCKMIAVTYLACTVFTHLINNKLQSFLLYNCNFFFIIA